MKTKNPNDIMAAEQDRLCEMLSETQSARALRRMRLRHRRALLWAGFRETEIATLFYDAVATCGAGGGK